MNLEYAKNPTWANKDKSLIDLIVKFKEIDEELPFTASPLDPEAHGKEIFKMAISGEFGQIQDRAKLPDSQIKELLTNQIVSERNELLASSDWTQLADARLAMGTEKAQQWDTYRQALRDITSQSRFPYQVTWPNKPA